MRDVLNVFDEKSIVYTHALATPSLQAIAMYAIRASIETIATPSVLTPSIRLIKMFDAQASECVYDDVHRITVLKQPVKRNTLPLLGKTLDGRSLRC